MKRAKPCKAGGQGYSLSKMELKWHREIRFSCIGLGRTVVRKSWLRAQNPGKNFTTSSASQHQLLMCPEPRGSGSVLAPGRPQQLPERVIAGLHKTEDLPQPGNIRVGPMCRVLTAVLTWRGFKTRNCPCSHGAGPVSFQSCLHIQDFCSML